MADKDFDLSGACDICNWITGLRRRAWRKWDRSREAQLKALGAWDADDERQRRRFLYSKDRDLRNREISARRWHDDAKCEQLTKDVTLKLRRHLAASHSLRVMLFQQIEEQEESLRSAF